MTLNSDSSAADSLIQWKRSVLSDVARHLTQTFGPKQPDALALWKWDGKLPYPSQEQVQVMDNGCMTVSFYANGLKVLISIWLMFGEIRIGIKLPARFALTDELQDMYSRLYDGTPSERKTEMSGAILIDWIFRDREFSKFDFMVRALCDSLASAVISDRIAQIVLHLFINLQDRMIENHQCVIEATLQDVKEAFVTLEITGEFPAIADYLRELNAEVLSHTQSDDHVSIEAMLSDTALEILHERVGHMLHSQAGEVCTLDAVKRSDTPFSPGIL